MKETLFIGFIQLINIAYSLSLTNQQADNLKSEETMVLMFNSYLENYNNSTFYNNYSFDYFKSNIQLIMAHNQQEEVTFKQGINQFTGLNLENFFNINQSRQQDFNQEFESEHLGIYIYDKLSNDTPAQWDWRKQQVSSQIYDQGSATDSQNFAALTVVQQHYTKKYYTQKELSLQQLRDCVPGSKDSQGCCSSYIFSFMAQEGGLALKDYYPETNLSQQCYYNFTIPSVLNLDDEYFGYKNVPAGREDIMMTALYEKGPLTVSMNAQSDFYKYQSGIYSSNNCSGNTNLALVIVGYGSENGTNYWIVQNSWGVSWGEQGYARIARGVSMCGIAWFASFPTNIVDPEIEKKRGFRVKLHNGNTAKCLDGSGAGIYYSQGYGTGIDKVVVAFEGQNEMCLGDSTDEVIQCALQRAQSKSEFGSSNNWSYLEDYDYIFKADPSDDYLFSNWHRFVLRDCSGAGHSGYIWDWIYQNQTYIFFRGHNSTKYGLNFVMEKVPLSLVSEFVLTGSKVGGLATLQWTDYFKQQIHFANPNIKYWAFVDSAFYTYGLGATFLSRLNNLYQVAYQGIQYQNEDCAQAMYSQSYMCFFGQNSVQYIQSPLFISQSLYDQYQVQNILNLTCALDLTNNQTTFYNCDQDGQLQLNSFKETLTKQLKKSIKFKNNTVIWAPSCPYSGFYERGNSERSQLYQVPQGSGYTLTAALRQFSIGVLDQQFIDEVDWPYNTDCAFETMQSQT